MKIFRTLEQLINAKALQSLKAYASDQPESIDWSIAGLKKEIVKERLYQAKKVQVCNHPFTAKLNGVAVDQPFIKHFGAVAVA